MPGRASMAGSGLLLASQLGSYSAWAGPGRGGHREGRQGRREYDYGKTKRSQARLGCNKPAAHGAAATSTFITPHTSTEKRNVPRTGYCMREPREARQ